MPHPLPCKPPLPLPLGEVAERSEDGEGKLGCNALSVTFGDSSPGGRAKGVRMLTQNCTHKNGHGEGNLGRNALSVTFGDSSPGGRAKGVRMLEREMERIRIDMLLFFLRRLGSLCQRDNGSCQFSGGGQRLVVGISGGAYLNQQPAGGQILVEPLAAQL